MRILLLFSYLLCASVQAITVGAEQPAAYLPLLADKQVAVVVNQTSRTHQQHLVDSLLAASVNVIRVLAPEHGFRGEKGAGEQIEDARDEKTGLPIVSLYGANKKPTPQMLADVDVLIFDIQDVGTRFYTYISTLHYVMEAAAENQVAVVVLDRPNPNGRFVDGPVRQPGFTSFVGLDPIPVLHGMTVGELARMIKGEGWIQHSQALDLTVIPVRHYQRDMAWSLPVPPSPNLPNDTAIRLYPSLCFFEATAVSIGRGTDLPFQLIGHDRVTLGDLSVTPRSRPQAPLPKLKDTPLQAMDLRSSAIEGLDLRLLIDTYKQFKQAGIPFFTQPDFMDKLAGTNTLRQAIEAGHSEAQIKASWASQLNAFKARRAPYLLYD